MEIGAPVTKNGGWSATNTAGSFSIDENASVRQPIVKEVTFTDNFSVESMAKDGCPSLRHIDLSSVFANTAVQSKELEINLDHSNEEPAATRTLGNSNINSSAPVIQKIELVEFNNGNKNVKFGASLNVPQSFKAVNTSSGQNFDFTMDPKTSKSGLGIVLYDASTLKAESGELKGHTIESLYGDVEEHTFSRKVTDKTTGMQKKEEKKVFTISDPNSRLLMIHEKCQEVLRKKAEAEGKNAEKYARAKKTDDGFIVSENLLFNVLKPQLSNHLKSESNFNINDFRIELAPVLPASSVAANKPVSSLAVSYKSEKNAPAKSSNGFKRLYDTNAMDIGLQKSVCNKMSRESTASIVYPMSVTLRFTVL